MRNWRQYGLMFCSAVLAAVAVFCTAARLPELHAGDAALAAAGFILPGGAAEAFRTELSEDVAASAPESSSQAPSSSSKPAASSSSKPVSSSASSGTVSETVTGTVREMSISNSGIQYENMWVKNTNQYHDIDIAAELAKQPAVKMKKDGTKQILIYHTHTTEAFAGSSRTQDNSQNVVAVGEEIKKQLKVEVDKRKIDIDGDVKAFGTYTCEIKLHAGVVAKVYAVVGEKE